ncbi:MAG: class I SAM-dependent methyltransferase [Bdellovibrionia bacterium]
MSTSSALASHDLEKSEAQFHDQWAASVDVSQIEVDALFESGSCPENRQVIRWMGDLRGKRVLDIGCGLGESSVYFAKKGALVTAVDISPGMLQVTNRLASRHGVAVETVEASAMDLSQVSDGQYDFVYAANLLHHVDIEAFLNQVQPKLKPGGSAVFWDPVHYNPVIQVYRHMATQVRTPDEHPLRRADLELIRSRFARVETRFYWYTALAIFLKFFLIDRIHPNQSRYWKKIIEDAPRIGRWLDVLHRIDRVLFSWVPGARWLAWNVAIRAQRSSSHE